MHFKTQFIFLGKNFILKVTGSDIEYYSQTGCSVPMSFATLQSILQWTLCLLSGTITCGKNVKQRHFMLTPACWRALIRDRPSPRHIVCQFQSPYTPSPQGLLRIRARQVALTLASCFSPRMLSFQIKDMERADATAHAREGQSKYIQRSHFRLILRKGFFGKMRHVLSQSSKKKPPFYVYCACAGTG